MTALGFWVCLLSISSFCKAGTLSGTVTDAQTGAILPNALVSLTPDEFSEVEIRKTTTSESGEYIFTTLYDMIVSAPGYDTQKVLKIEVGSGEGARSVKDVRLEESLKPAEGFKMVLNWDGPVYDLDSHIYSSCGCHAYYDNAECHFRDHPLSFIKVLSDSKYGAGTSEEIILNGLTCGVYDYYVSIYSKGFSFNDAEPRIEIYTLEEAKPGEPKKPAIAEFRPPETWSNSSNKLFWWAARITVNASGDVDIQNKEELRQATFPQDKCKFSIPCAGTRNRIEWPSFVVLLFLFSRIISS